MGYALCQGFVISTHFYAIFIPVCFFIFILTSLTETHVFPVIDTMESIFIVVGVLWLLHNGNTILLYLLNNEIFLSYNENTFLLYNSHNENMFLLW